MKKTLRLFAMALMAGAMFTACGGDDPKTPEVPKKPGGDEVYPENVVISKKPSGSVKAGIVGAIEVLGENFDSDWDVVRIGYKDEAGNVVVDADGKMVTELLVNDTEVVIKGSRITAGIPIGSASLGRKATLYLDRPGYSLMPITEELTITVPEVKDGYIPDPAFRSMLTRNNRVVFNPLGLLDVEAAKILKSGSDDGDMVYGLNLCGCQATSLEGIELFENLEGLVVGWAGGLPNIKKIDFSKWQAKGIDIRIQGNPLLEEIIGSPYCYQILASACPKLKRVDLHLCRGLRSFSVSGENAPGQDFDPNAKQGTVTFLDMRKEQGGWYRNEANGGFVDSNPNGKLVVNEDQHTTYGSVGAKLADGAEVWVDSWWIADHSGWADIYNGWKDHGVTVKVFSRFNPQFSENKLLGTIPTYQQAPDALNSGGTSLGSTPPANKWKFDDPSTRTDYPGYEPSWGNDESGAVYGATPWNPIPGPGIDAIGTL